MLIKDSKKILNLNSYFKFLFKFKSIVIIAILIVYSFLLIFLGFYLHRNGYTAYINKFIIHPKHYSFLDQFKLNLKARFSQEDKIYLDIKFKDFKKLSNNRNMALEKKFIFDENNKNVNASIRFRNKIIPVKIKLKGGIVDHHLNDNGWSLKVRALKSNLFGLTEFALMHAKRRNYLLEWYARKLFYKEGFIYKEYKFVNLTINGENNGIYVIDENYTESLSIKNNRRKGIFVRYDNDINIFSQCCDAAIDSDNHLQATRVDVMNQQLNSKTSLDTLKNYNLAKKLLEDFRVEKKTAEEVFDLELMAKAFALSDVLGANHAMGWGNMKFYFDSINSKLEPVFDDFYNETTIYEGSKAMLIRKDYDFLFKQLFKSKFFLEKYIINLKRYIEPNFLKNFNREIRDEFDSNFIAILKHHPIYLFPFNVIEDNVKQIEKFLNPYEPLFFSLWSKKEDKITLKLANTSELPVEIQKIQIINEDNSSNLIDLANSKISKDQLYLKPRFYGKSIDYNFVDIDLESINQFNKITLFYKIPGLEKRYSKSLKYPQFRKDRDDIIFNILRDTSSSFKNLDLFEDKIIFKKGLYNIASDLVIPKNKELVISAGTNINLINGSKIISNSHIIAKGNEEDPIKIFSSDNSGQCILIMNDINTSILNYVYFKNLSNCSTQTLELTGAITFYRTNIVMDHVSFEDNVKGDDYLNLINSKFELRNLIFINTFADALDIDFSEGKISGFVCKNCKNDAIDLSNSSISIENILADNIGDKAISVGENSFLKGNNISINKSFIGLAIKDQSEVNIDKINIDNSNIGIATYIKKQEFNPSYAKINNYSSNNNSEDQIIEFGTTILINGKENNNYVSNVYDKIYSIGLN